MSPDLSRLRRARQGKARKAEREAQVPAADQPCASDNDEWNAHQKTDRIGCKQIEWRVIRNGCVEGEPGIAQCKEPHGNREQRKGSALEASAGHTTKLE